MPEDEGNCTSRPTSTIYDRLKQQKVNLVDLVSTVQKGTKHDLILGLVEAVSMGTSWKEQDMYTLDCDGLLDIQDLLDLSNCMHSKKNNGSQFSIFLLEDTLHKKIMSVSWSY